MADPKFVRLADHLTRGMRADLNSGFSIAGLDVVAMPDPDEEPEQYAYVKGEINTGRLESASQAEYDEVHPDIYGELGYEVEAPKVTTTNTVQETEVQRVAARATRKVRANRAVSGESYEEVDEARRLAVIAEQSADDSPARKRRRSTAATVQGVPEGADESDED